MDLRSDNWTWRPGEVPPKIQDHSKAKLELLGSYLREYLRIIGGTQKRYGYLKLTVVDAFCGGGEFRSGDRDEAEIKGSPLVLLDAAQIAREELRESIQESSFDWNVRFVFNDVAFEHTAYLRQALKTRGYELCDSSIQILTGEFEAILDQMIAAAKDLSPRSGRSLWILDQTGWSAATLASIARILRELPKSEVILTLARDNLLRLAIPNPYSQAALRTLGLGESVLRDLAELVDGKHTGAVAQRMLMQEIASRTNATEYSCFVLEPAGSRRAIVLVHLVNHERARDAMVDVQWSLDGAFYHFAGEPAKVLSYRGLLKGDETSGALDLRFTEHERDWVRSELTTHLRSEVHGVPGGKTMQDVMSAYRNRTPVTAEDVREIVSKEVGMGNMELSDESGIYVNGSSRKILRRLQGRDGLGYRVMSPKQLRLFSL